MFITPAVAGRLVFVGSCSGKLFALADSTGDVVWSYDTRHDGPAAQFHSDPALVGDLLIVGTDTDSIGHLYAFESATGAVRWKHAFAGGVAAQVIVRGSKVFAMTGNNEVAAVDIASGAIRWRAAGPPEAGPAFNISDPVLAGDRLVVGWRAGSLDAYDPETGSVVWRTALLSPVNTSVFVYADTVAIGTLDGFMHRLRLADGADLGRVDLGGMPFGDVVPAGDVVLLLVRAGEVDRVEAWAPDFSRKQWEYSASKPWSVFHPAVQGGAVLVGWEGRIVALDIATGAELGACDVGGQPRGLAWHGRTSYVGLLQGGVLRLETAD